MKLSELPSQNEIVIVKITKVLSYGAFCELMEYPNVSGFIHVSQVASGWIKNIRAFIKENQLRAAKVLSVNNEKREVDLSLNKVSPQIEKQKIDEFNQFNRAKKLLEVLAKRERISFDFVWDKIAVPLLEEYGSLNEAFKKIAMEKEKAVPQKIPEKMIKSLIDIVSENIVLPKKTISATIKVFSNDGFGLNLIKKFFEELLAKASNEVNCYYKGSGNYALVIQTTDYKKAEKILKEFNEKALNLMKKYSLQGSITRDET